MKNKAGFLSGDHVSYELKEKFLRELLDNLFFLYENFDKNDVISVYKEKSYVIGKNVKIIRGEEVVFGTVSDVTEEGELVLDTDLGKRVFLSGTLEVL